MQDRSSRSLAHFKINSSQQPTGLLARRKPDPCDAPGKMGREKWRQLAGEVDSPELAPQSQFYVVDILCVYIYTAQSLHVRYSDSM